MIATPLLTTSRLILRPLELADHEQAQPLFGRWEVVRYLRNQVPWPYPPDGAYTFYREIALPQMQRGEAWHWSLRLKATPQQMIGSISLIKGDTDNRGFWIAPPWWGQGLASEAADAVTDFWFDVLDFERLVVPKAAENVASRKISEKQNMRLVGTEFRDYVSGRLPTEIWAITRQEWHARRNAEKH
ncbi:MAG TPA: GNAT family N-acetyltransferase [Candidatus Angelobacter sp.]|nr:GNAT family N-acetyltransferase [Candidatus Angelobacter sp.]